MILSIIVPFYNAASSLRKTVESLQQQTLFDIEIILIDDGSTDNGFAIAKEIAKEDDRIKIFQQENKGVSSARNQGLQLARGSYVTFVDADDLVDKTMYEKLMANVFEFNVDVCISGIKINDVPLEDLPKNNNLLEGKKQIHRVIVGNILGHPANSFIISPSVWRFIIDRKLLVDYSIQFDTRIGFHEDFVFCIDLFLRVNRAYIDARPFYNYSYNKSERTQRHKISKIVESHKFIIRFLEGLNERTSENIRINIHFGMIRFITSVCENICLMYSKSISKQLKILKQFYSAFKPPNIDGYFEYKNILLKKRMLFWLFSHRFFVLIVMVCWLVRIRASFHSA